MLREPDVRALLRTALQAEAEVRQCAQKYAKGGGSSDDEGVIPLPREKWASPRSLPRHDVRAWLHAAVLLHPLPVDEALNVGTPWPAARAAFEPVRECAVVRDRAEVAYIRASWLAREVATQRRRDLAAQAAASARARHLRQATARREAADEALAAAWEEFRGRAVAVSEATAFSQQQLQLYEDLDRAITQVRCTPALDQRHSHPCATCSKPGTPWRTPRTYACCSASDVHGWRCWTAPAKRLRRARTSTNATPARGTRTGRRQRSARGCRGGRPS